LESNEELRYRIFEVIHSGGKLPNEFLEKCKKNPQLGGDALSMSISSKNDLAFTQLCHAGISGNQITCTGSSPIIAAANCLNKSAIIGLHSFGANLDEKPSINVPRPIFYAIGREVDCIESEEFIEEMDELCSKLLFKLGVNPNVVGNEVESPIDFAKRHGHPAYST
jgi:ankyrin repeat protein